jgi:HEPN domain-containing protein
MSIACLLEQIDAVMRAEAVPIPFRPMHAMGRLAEERRRTLSRSSQEEVYNWFKERYGDRLRGLTRLGRIPLLLRRDVHVLVLGPHATLIGTTIRPSYAWAIDAGPQFYQSLTGSELTDLHELSRMGFRCFSELSPCVCDRALSESATADLESAVDELLRPAGPALGLSAWASHQAAEKSLKEFLRAKGKEPDKIHEIWELHDEAVTLGLPNIRGILIPEGAILELLDIPPAARYDEIVVSIPLALGAYYSALIVCSTIAAKLRAERGGKNWLASGGESPAMFVVRRLCEIGRVKSCESIFSDLALFSTTHGCGEDGIECPA